MNTNKYIYLVFYDIPTCENTKPYRIFRKHLKNYGALMLQESVYFIYLRNKEESLKIKSHLALIAPEDSNVRGMIITLNQFDTIDLINGEMNTGEKLVSKKFKIIEI